MVIPSTTRVLTKLIGGEVTAINAGYVPLPMSKHKLDFLLFQGLYHFCICFDSGANVFFAATPPPLRTDCLSFSQSQFSVANPSLYLKDGKLSLRSLNSGAAVGGSTPKNCLHLFIFRVRLTLPWRFASNPAYERPAERISMSVKM